MGIAPACAKMLMIEGLRSPLTGRVLTLGKQDVSLTPQKLRDLSDDTKFNLSQLVTSSSPTNTALASQGYISDKTLFHALGFSEVRSLDFSDYQQADELFDLNNPTLPPYLVGAFDVVFDGGTIEHVFHLPNALKNISDMTKERGRIIHVSPSSNHIDHGFYMFSPTLFYDYYLSNGFEINTFQVFQYSRSPNVDPWLIYDYTPGCLDSVSFGGLDDAMYGVLCIVTKPKNVSCQVIPQQGSYIKTWHGRDSSNTNTLANTKQSQFGAIKEAIKNNPSIYRNLKPLVDWARYLKGKLFFGKKGLNLRLKARY